MNNAINYCINHWSHISTGILTVAIFCIAHGGVKGIALAIWRGKQDQPTASTEGQTKQS